MKLSQNISISIDNVTKKYTKVYGIKNVNVTFKQGNLNVLVGENGSGKSTLLKCIMGLISYDGKIIKRRYKIGYAPEEYVMPDFMSITEFLHNIGRIKGMNDNVFKMVQEDYLKAFDLYNYRNKPIKILSNGMKQKVNLLQAIIHEPKIVILDEPLASLDKLTQKEIIKIINEKAKDSLVIVSTHHPEKFKSRKKILYKMHKGEIIQNELS